MISPHPPRLRMKRRKTVSVTPAMGARTVAGVMVMPPMEKLAGTGCSGAAWRARVPAPYGAGSHEPFELSQNFFTVLFYLAWQNKAPAGARAEVPGLIRNPWQRLALGRGCGSLFLGVLAAEALHAAGGVHQLLLAGEKGMAVGANFNADVAFMGGPCHKRVAAGTMHADFVVSGMNGCFHRGSNLDLNH